MRLELATMDDAKQMGDWAVSKLEGGYQLSLEELQGTILKVANAFFIPARQAIFLGPLIPDPLVDGKTLTLAMLRMIKTIRLNFKGDVVYLNYEENGVDQAAREIGGFEEVPGVTVTTSHGTARLMLLRGEMTAPTHYELPKV